MICASDPGSKSCQVAWDIVEELKAAESHRSSGVGTFIDPNYTDIDTLLYSFDILVKKIDGKMDQLKATTDKMQELGASDPSVRELGELAEYMKQQLTYVRNGLNQ